MSLAPLPTSILRFPFSFLIDCLYCNLILCAETQEPRNLSRCASDSDITYKTSYEWYGARGDVASSVSLQIAISSGEVATTGILLPIKEEEGNQGNCQPSDLLLVASHTEDRKSRKLSTS